MITNESLKSIKTVQINAIFEHTGDEFNGGEYSDFNGVLHIVKFNSYRGELDVMCISSNEPRLSDQREGIHPLDGFGFTWLIGSQETCTFGNDIINVKILTDEEER